MGARDFFESVRDAAIEADRTERMLLRMEAREGMRGGSVGPHGSGGTHDPMSATDARVDMERLWRTRMERDYELVDVAARVLYGRGHDGDGGVAALLGTSYADLLWWRYCYAGTWEEAARASGWSESQARRVAVWTAFDFMDANGLTPTIEGIGLA